MTTRASGRQPDDLRRGHVRSRLHRDGDRFGARRVRPHARAVHRVARRPRSAVAEGLGQGLGHRRVLDAAGIVAGARRARSRTRQAERPYAGDPAADRPVVARRHRPARDARRAAHRRLRRAPGRRRHAHRVDLRRLDRAARRVQPAARQGHAQPSPGAAAGRRDLGRRDRRHADARPRVHRRRARRSRHERRDDRRRPLRRGAGHGRGRRVHARRARCAARRSPRAASPRSSPRSRRWSPRLPRREPDDRLAVAARPGDGQRRQGPRDHRDPRRP